MAHRQEATVTLQQQALQENTVRTERFDDFQAARYGSEAQHYEEFELCPRCRKYDADAALVAWICRVCRMIAVLP